MHAVCGRMFLITLVLVLVGCGSDGGPTSATNRTTPSDLLPGRVTPVLRESVLLATAEAGSDERDVQLELFGPGALDLATFQSSGEAMSSGTNDFGRSASGTARATQTSSFLVDADQKVTGWSFDGLAEYLGNVAAGDANSGDVGVSLQATTDLRFDFLVEDEGMVLVSSGRYVVSGDNFCVEISAVGDGVDERWDLDLCEEIGEGTFAFADTLALRNGVTYEFRIQARAFDNVMSSGATGASQGQASASFDADFRVKQRPMEP